MSDDLRELLNDPLVGHYVDLVVHIEHLIVALVAARSPFTPNPPQLAATDVLAIAVKFAHGARLAHEETPVETTDPLGRKTS